MAYIQPDYTGEEMRDNVFSSVLEMIEARSPLLKTSMDTRNLELPLSPEDFVRSLFRYFLNQEVFACDERQNIARVQALYRDFDPCNEEFEDLSFEHLEDESIYTFAFHVIDTTFDDSLDEWITAEVRAKMIEAMDDMGIEHS